MVRKPKNVTHNEKENQSIETDSVAEMMELATRMLKQLQLCLFKGKHECKERN